MERDYILTRVKCLEGSIIETTTNQWGHENGDPTYFSHTRDTYQLREFLEYNDNLDQYRFLAYSYQFEEESYYTLESPTIKRLLYRGCEILRGGGDPEVVVETTRIIDDIPTKVLKNTYLVREWWRTVVEDEGNVVKEKDLYVDLLKVDEVTYDPKDAIYIVEVTSQCSGESEELYYFSEEVEKIILGERTCAIYVQNKREDGYTLYENTYLLPERVPEELKDKGVEWLLSEEGIEWLRDSHVQVHTLDVRGEGPTPRPVPRDCTDKSHDKRLDVPTLSFEFYE